MTDLAIGAVVVLFAIVALMAVTVMRAVWIVPQARARNVERFGRYHRTLQPGINFIVPFVDRVKPLIDLREQVVSFSGQSVITEDNLVVRIDTVLFFQVTDPKAADYEIVNYIGAIEQLTATTLRNVIGTMDLEESLTSRDKINTALRGVLDEASGKWGIRVTRVEIKAIEPPPSIKDAMEKQMRAEREKRATVLQAEGVRQAKILTAEGEKQSAILRAEGAKQSAILEAEGQSTAIDRVFGSIHRNDPDPKLLAYQYLQTLPKLAQGQGSTFWVIPGELTSALQSITQAFAGEGRPAAGRSGTSGADGSADADGSVDAGTQNEAGNETEPDMAALNGGRGTSPGEPGALEAGRGSASPGPAELGSAEPGPAELGPAPALTLPYEPAPGEAGEQDLR